MARLLSHVISIAEPLVPRRHAQKNVLNSAAILPTLPPINHTVNMVAEHHLSHTGGPLLF